MVIFPNSRTKQRIFKATICVFFGIAVIGVLARFIGRMVTRRRLYLDDAFLCFALICLCAGTGLIVHFYKVMFIDEALATDPTVVIVPSQLLELFNSLTIVDAFFCIMWTATFSVKASFLALFRQLISRVSRKLTIYYWCTVALTLLAWAFFECEDFIVCPHFGEQVSEYQV